MSDRERELIQAIVAAKAEHLSRVEPICRELAEIAGKEWNGVIWVPEAA